MEAERKQRLEARAKILKAMAHPSRLLVIEELTEGRKCVCDLTDLIGADISTVSKHLSVLKNANIITDEREGTKIFYSLKVPCILNFFACAEEVLRQGVQ